MPERGSRGPYTGTAQRRADILRAARESFAERGYAKASLRDIANRAGVTHAGLLHHFPGKDALLVALLAQRDEDELRQSAESNAPGSDRRALLERLLRDHQESPELMRLWAELTVAASRQDNPAHAYFTDRYRRARAAFADGFTDGSAGGPLDVRIDAGSAAVLFVALLDGLQIQWLLDPTLDIIGPLNRFRDLLTGPAEPSS